ncbi:MAG: type II toxin-antitoxin system RelE/ParE family toxin [Gemmataceae bacterium]
MDRGRGRPTPGGPRLPGADESRLRAGAAGRIVDRSEALDGRPHAGAEVPEYGDPDLREVFEHPYRILYRVNGPDIEVLAVLHFARRLPRNPPE